MSLVVLDVYFNVFGLLGSFAVVQVLRPIAFDEYFRNLFAVLTPGDLLSGFAKSLVFGVIISVVSLYRGFARGEVGHRGARRGHQGGGIELHALHLRGRRHDGDPVPRLAEWTERRSIELRGVTRRPPGLRPCCAT